MDSTAIASLGALTRYFSMHTYGVGCEEGGLLALYALRYQTYCLECGFLPPADYPDGLEIDAFDSRAAHFAATNTEGHVAGTVRLVLSPNGEAFPFERHCPSFDDFKPPPSGEAAEVSRLAVRSQYRRRAGDTVFGFNTATADSNGSKSQSSERRTNSPLLVLGLYRQMYRYSCDNGIRYWYAAMERTLARVLARFDFVFTPIGLERDYYGPVTPYLADLREIEQRLAESKPELLEWFRHGL